MPEFMAGGVERHTADGVYLSATNLSALDLMEAAAHWFYEAAHKGWCPKDASGRLVTPSASVERLQTAIEIWNNADD